MRSYERNGITVDQCTGCRGVFLDRGELERLIDGENDFYRSSPGGGDVRPAPGGYTPGGYAPGYGPRDEGYRDRDHRFGDRFDRRRNDRWDDDDDDRRGRGGFLGGLLDFD
jgi:Zn-finger nucleic acid-binding protein